METLILASNLGGDIYPLQTETSTLILCDVKILTIQKMGGLVSFSEIHFCHTHQGKLKNWRYYLNTTSVLYPSEYNTILKIHYIQNNYKRLECMHLKYTLTKKLVSVLYKYNACNF